MTLVSRRRINFKLIQTLPPAEPTTNNFNLLPNLFSEILRPTNFNLRQQLPHFLNQITELYSPIATRGVHNWRPQNHRFLQGKFQPNCTSIKVFFLTSKRPLSLSFRCSFPPLFLFFYAEFLRARQITLCGAITSIKHRQALVQAVYYSEFTME